MKMKLHVELIFVWKVLHLDSFWNRELGNGLHLPAYGGLSVFLVLPLFQGFFSEFSSFPPFTETNI